MSGRPSDTLEAVIAGLRRWAPMLKAIDEPDIADTVAEYADRLAALAPVTADFAKSFPDGSEDRCDYQAVEDALDRAQAPARVGGKWLTLPERIAALAPVTPAGGMVGSARADIEISLPMGCGCVDVEIGSYRNQVELPTPPHMLAIGSIGCLSFRPTTCVDRCIAPLVQALWASGVITTGCCCGHNQRSGYVGILGSPSRDQGEG